MKCQSCGAEVQGSKCAYCGSELPNREVQQNITIINNYNNSTNTNINTSSVYTNNNRRNVQTYSRKSKGLAIFLCCLSFIGLGGLHRFYVGKKVSGFFHLFTIGFMWIGTIVDLVILAKGNFKDSNGLILK